MVYKATAKPAVHNAIHHTGDNVKEFRAEYGDASVTVEDGNTYRVRLPGTNNVVDVPEGAVLVVSPDYVGKVMDAEAFTDQYDIAEEPPEETPEESAEKSPEDKADAKATTKKRG